MLNHPASISKLAVDEDAGALLRGKLRVIHARTLAAGNVPAREDRVARAP